MGVGGGRGWLPLHPVALVKPPNIIWHDMPPIFFIPRDFFICSEAQHIKVQYFAIPVVLNIMLGNKFLFLLLIQFFTQTYFNYFLRNFSNFRIYATFLRNLRIDFLGKPAFFARTVASSLENFYDSIHYHSQIIKRKISLNSVILISAPHKILKNSGSSLVLRGQLGRGDLWITVP